MMTSVRAPALALGLAVALSACGKSEEKAPSTPTASAPAPKAAVPLKGEGWIGSPVDPTAATGKVVALAFFKPG